MGWQDNLIGVLYKYPKYATKGSGEMSFDKLKGKMVEAHVSQAKLSEKLGITVQSLNAKLNGRTQFTLEEAVRITEFLNLKDPIDIFFDPSVPKMQRKTDAQDDG